MWTGLMLRNLRSEQGYKGFPGVKFGFFGMSFSMILQVKKLNNFYSHVDLKLPLHFATGHPVFKRKNIFWFLM